MSNIFRAFMAGRLLGLLLASSMFVCQSLAKAVGDPDRGASAFRACGACHSVEPGRHMSGPSLARVWDRKAGTAEGFLRYSDALKKSGVVWNEKTLDKWLENPGRFIPRNEMTFSGIKERTTRQDIIAFLKAVAEGKALPADTGQGGMMGMMGGGPMPNLKESAAEARITRIRYCPDTYFVTTAKQTVKIWEFNLRFKTDSSKNGPNPGKPVLVKAGMMGDRAFVIFASPSEISSFIKQACE